MSKLFGIFFLVFTACSYFSQENSGQLIIKIFPVFNQSALVLSNQVNINANSDSVYIDEFKFYMSNFCFKMEGSNQFCEKESYHLIDAEDSLTQTIVLKNIPGGTYTSFAFAIGVDSIKNVSGALTGDLDPIKGMYWTWNTGYIAAKISGHAPACRTLHHEFEFHIGGYLAPYSSLRNNSLKLEPLSIISGKTTVLEIYADAAEWFKTPVVVDISRINSIVIPSKQSVMIAQNYEDMIKFKKSVNP